jgi:hypothetical protein
MYHAGQLVLLPRRRHDLDKTSSGASGTREKRVLWYENPSTYLLMTSSL